MPRKIYKQYLFAIPLCFLLCIGISPAQTNHKDILVGSELSKGFDISAYSSEHKTDWLTKEIGYIKMSFPPYQEWAAVSITVGRPKDPPRPAIDLSSYKSFSIDMRGESGGEVIEIGIKSNIQPDTGEETKVTVRLTPEWKTYQFPLESFPGTDLTHLYVVTEFIYNDKTPQTVYFRSIRYQDRNDPTGSLPVPAVVVPETAPLDITRQLTDAAKLEAKVSRSIQSAETELKERARKLMVVKGKLANGAAFQGYDAKQVGQLLEETKAQLLEFMNEAELSGLRAYVLKFYPEALKTYRVKPVNHHSFNMRPINVVGPSDIYDLLLATPESKNLAIAAAMSFLHKLSEHSKTIDLTVTSEPDEASFELKTDFGSFRTTTTNSQFANVFRGLYKYKVIKQGYKTIEQQLNLVDEPGTIVKCKLYRSKTSDGPNPCKLN